MKNEKKKNCFIQFRVTKALKDQIFLKNKRNGMSLSSYLRYLLNADEVPPIMYVEKCEQLYSVIQEHRSELNRIGNNLNQIAKFLNSIGQADSSTVDYFRNFLMPAIDEQNNLLQTLKQQEKNIMRQLVSTS